MAGQFTRFAFLHASLRTAGSDSINGLAENLDPPGAVEDLAGERALGGEADEYDGVTPVPQVVLEMMAHPAAGAHA